jgi:hypothetical protein
VAVVIFSPTPVALSWAAEFTEKVLKPAGKAYAYKYGPAVHGHIGKTLHRALVEDPLGTALDVATVATLGAAASVKAGSALRSSAERDAPQPWRDRGWRRQDGRDGDPRLRAFPSAAFRC